MRGLKYIITKNDSTSSAIRAPCRLVIFYFHMQEILLYRTRALLDRTKYGFKLRRAAD